MKQVFKVQGKTFKVVNGKVEVSMFDLQSRINKVNQKAYENGWKVVYVK